MSAINVTSVEVLDNPTNFANPLQFEIQYECLYQLAHGAHSLPPPPSAHQPTVRTCDWGRVGHGSCSQQGTKASHQLEGKAGASSRGKFQLQ